MIIITKSFIDMNAKVERKNSFLIDTLMKILEADRMNTTQAKFTGFFITLGKVQTVGFEKIYKEC